MTTIHLASILRQSQDGTWSCRDPSPTWCSSSPLSPVTANREACTCLACLRAEARIASETCDATQVERNRLREALAMTATVVRWVHSGAGQERAPRRILAAAREAVKGLPSPVELLEQSGAA